MIGGAAAIVFGAAVLAVATAQQNAGTPGKAAIGIIAALGAGCMFGTMYIPYRKAYISGMNPLSFVTIFTFGELGTVLSARLRSFIRRHRPRCSQNCTRARTMLFWPFRRRILLGHRRPVSALCGEVYRHRARHSALEHQPALGPWRGARWCLASLLALPTGGRL